MKKQKDGTQGKQRACPQGRPGSGDITPSSDLLLPSLLPPQQDLVLVKLAPNEVLGFFFFFLL